MKHAPEIRFIGMEASAALASAAREKSAKLELLCADISSCQVVIEVPHKHQQQGRTFAVRLALTVPGRSLSVSRTEHEDAYVALRNAFDNMKRQLEDSQQRSRDIGSPREPSFEEGGRADSGSEA